MWYFVENSENTKPAEVDAISSRSFVYVRRNIVRVNKKTAEGETVGTHYKWEETKIPRDAWEICKQVLEHDAALEDVYAALTELAGLIVEG